MNAADRERTAPIQERALALARRQAELTREVDATLAATVAALERARALSADPQRVTARRRQGLV
jgi:hypothetical protein